jgi:hypothetical protein
VKKEKALRQGILFPPDEGSYQNLWSLLSIVPSSKSQKVELAISERMKKPRGCTEKHGKADRSLSFSSDIDHYTQQVRIGQRK